MSRVDRSRKPYSRPATRSKAVDEGQWLHDKAPGQGQRRLKASAPNVTFEDSVANTKLIVSNLHYEVTPRDLSSIFGQIGTLITEPQIKYDNSGRSTGNAFVTFETAAEATRAKKQFDGVLAKGQPMSVAFAPVTAPRKPNQQRRASAPGSLMDRIEKAPLLERLTKKDSSKDKKEPKKDARKDAKNTKVTRSDGPGPIRTRTGRGGRNREPKSKKPKTAEELDTELDAFMGDDVTSAAAKPSFALAEAGMSAPPPLTTESALEAAPAGALEKDVEMA